MEDLTAAQFNVKLLEAESWGVICRLISKGTVVTQQVSREGGRSSCYHPEPPLCGGQDTEGHQEGAVCDPEGAQVLHTEEVQGLHHEQGLQLHLQDRNC